MVWKSLFYSTDSKARLAEVITSGADTKCISLLFTGGPGGKNIVKRLQLAKKLCCKCEFSKQFDDPQRYSVA